MKRFLALILWAVLFLAAPSNLWAQTADFEDLSLGPESFWNGDDETGDFVSNGVTFSNHYNAEWYSWDGFAYSNITDIVSSGYEAQYNAITGSGADGSEIYAVAYVSAYAGTLPTITLETEQTVTGAYFTNNNYAYYSMKNGDDFAKKFTADDWFKLTITGFDTQEVATGTVEFKLADGTRVLNEWTWVDLSALGPVKQLTFSLSSTDNGDWGMNTPSYFCLDSFNKKETDDDNDRDKDRHDSSSCFIRSLLSGNGHQ